MKFTGKFFDVWIDLDGYQAALDTAMREIMAQAVMEWLSAVLDEIPFWSGASRATFVKLAETIGMSVPAVASVLPGSRGGALHTVGDRTSLGQENSQGKLNFNEPPGFYTFTYQTSLPHLIWNEYHNANQEPDETKWKPPALLLKPGPYEFQAKGLIAFNRFAKGVVLPSVAPFVRGTRMEVG